MQQDQKRQKSSSGITQRVIAGKEACQSTFAANNVKTKLMVTSPTLSTTKDWPVATMASLNRHTGYATHQSTTHFGPINHKKQNTQFGHRVISVIAKSSSLF